MIHIPVAAARQHPPSSASTVADQKLEMRMQELLLEACQAKGVNEVSGSWFSMCTRFELAVPDN